MIEKSIGIVKKIMKKAVYDGKDLHLALLEYRNTPSGRNTIWQENTWFTTTKRTKFFIRERYEIN